MIKIMSLPLFDHFENIPHRSRALRQGALLFDRDDPVREVLRVDCGEIQLRRRQIDGAEFILQRAFAGALLAEASVNSATYHCAAVAVTDARVTAWPRQPVQDMLAGNPAAAAAYAEYLAREVRVARLRAEIASLRRVSERLDAWLTWHDGILPPKGQWHTVAQEINSSPAALYRELSRRRSET